MSLCRPIKMIVKGRVTKDGAGVKLYRVFSYKLAQLFDPFLLLDVFGSENSEDYMAGFPWHPHRGIETVTYVLSGSVEHTDSAGNVGVISDGDCQWMTAGSGILHQEMPVESELLMGIQLWVNLPKVSKMIQPSYREIKREQIQTVNVDGSLVKVIAGKFKEHIGPAAGIVANPTFLDVKLPVGVSFELETKEDDTVFAYVISGEGIFHPQSTEMVETGSAVLFEHGTKIQIQSRSEELHFLLFSGKPLKEAIAWRGPIVMNTDEELDEALRQLEDRTFIK